MFLSSIALVKTLPCLAEPGKIIIIGKPSRPLDDILPYLAVLPDIIAFNPHAHSLTFRRRTGFMTLYSDQVIITKVDNVDAGIELLNALTDAINVTWDHRDELVAATAIRRAPGPLDIYSLLPQTNCQKCGEATCMAFACALLLQNRNIDECTPLRNDPQFGERVKTLKSML
jgi:ArsR family metal-binding transcriptional regulator